MRTHLLKGLFGVFLLLSGAAHATYFDTFYQHLTRYQAQAESWQKVWTSDRGYPLMHAYQVISAELAQLVDIYGQDKRLSQPDVIHPLSDEEEAAFETLKQSMTFMAAEPLEVETELAGFHQSVVALLTEKKPEKPVLFGFVPTLQDDLATIQMYGVGLTGEFVFNGFSVTETLKVDGASTLSVVIDRALLSKTQSSDKCEPVKPLEVSLTQVGTDWSHAQALLGSDSAYAITARYVGLAGDNAYKVQEFSYSSKPVTAKCGAEREAKFRFIMPHKRTKSLTYSADWEGLPDSAESSTKTKKLKHAIVVEGTMSAGEGQECPIKGVLSLKGQYQYSLPPSAKVSKLFDSRLANPGDKLTLALQKDRLHGNAQINMVRLKLYRTGCSKTLDNLTISLKPGKRSSKYGRFKTEVKGNKIEVSVVK